MPRGDKQKEKGEARLQTVLAAISARPMTIKELAEAVGFSQSSASNYMLKLNAEPRRVYVCGHTKSHGGIPGDVWAAGNLSNVEYVPLDRPARKTTSGERLQQVIDLLTKNGPMTVRQLAKHMHMVPRAAGKYVKLLRDQTPRALCISSWLHPAIASPGSRPCTWVPVYAVGHKKDKVRPLRETSAERHARLHSNPEYRKKKNEARRHYHIVMKARKKPQSIFAALGL